MCVKHRRFRSRVRGVAIAALLLFEGGCVLRQALVDGFEFAVSEQVGLIISEWFDALSDDLTESAAKQAS